MSIQLVCDICGKDSGRGQAVFNMGSIELVVKNFKDQEFKIFIKMEIKDKKDFDFLESLTEKTAEELDTLSHDETLVIHTPDPHICTVCQRALASQALTEGIINKNENYTQETEVTLQAFVLPQEKLDELDEFYGREFNDDDDDYEFIDEDEDEDDDEEEL